MSLLEDNFTAFRGYSDVCIGAKLNQEAPHRFAEVHEDGCFIYLENPQQIKQLGEWLIAMSERLEAETKAKTIRDDEDQAAIEACLAEGGDAFKLPYSPVKLEPSSVPPSISFNKYLE